MRWLFLSFNGQSLIEMGQIKKLDYASGDYASGD